MSILISLVPLVAMVVMLATIAKLGAWLFRRTKLSWKHALIFAVFISVLSAGGAVLNRASGWMLPLPVAVLAGLALHLALGGWYFGPRASTAAGVPLAFKGGVLLALVAYGIAFVLGVVGALAIPMLHRGS
jgi:hypothetical protein